MLFRNLTKTENESYNRKIGKIRIVYAGLLGIAQDVLAICEHLDFESLNTELHIFGAGNQKDRIIRLNKPGVIYHDPVSKEEIQQLMSIYDFSLVPLRNYIFGAFPSKITAAVASAIPILFLGEGEGASIVNQLKIGKTFRFDDFNSLSSYLKSYSENREEAGLNYYHNLIKAQNESFNLIKNNNKLIEFLKNQ